MFLEKTISKLKPILQRLIGGGGRRSWGTQWGVKEETRALVGGLVGSGGVSLVETPADFRNGAVNRERCGAVHRARDFAAAAREGKISYARREDRDRGLSKTAVEADGDTHQPQSRASCRANPTQSEQPCRLPPSGANSAQSRGFPSTLNL